MDRIFLPKPTLHPLFQRKVLPIENFWTARLNPSIKQILLISLGCCFALQTLLVYSDPTRKSTLSDHAVQGKKIWHNYNCQACHQIYGFGGFLGPDLTNSFARIDESRWQFVLTEGSKQMPAYQLSSTKIEALKQFFNELNETGQGQAKQKEKLGEGGDPATQFTALAPKLLAEAPKDVKEGFEAIRIAGCMSCHTPLVSDPVGPEFSQISGRLSEAEIDTILKDGRPPKMPRPKFSPVERPKVHAYLRWLATNRDTVCEQVIAKRSERRLRWRDLPWWEYR